MQKIKDKSKEKYDEFITFSSIALKFEKQPSFSYLLKYLFFGNISKNKIKLCKKISNNLSYKLTR